MTENFAHFISVRNLYLSKIHFYKSWRGGLFANASEWNYRIMIDNILQGNIRFFSRSVMSNSLQPHELQHTRPPCPSPTPGVHPNPCPSSQWCHPTISSSVVPSGKDCCLNLSQHQGLFKWVSSSHQVAKILELQLQHRFLQWTPRTDLVARLDLLAVQRTLKSLLQHDSSKASILRCSDFFIVQLSHPYMTTGKTIALTRRTFVSKVMSLLFNMLSRLVITFLPRSKRLLISWLQSPSAVIFGAQKNKLSPCFHCFPIYLPWSDRTGCHDLSFLNVKF